MRVVYTEPALSDLESILSCTAEHFPRSLAGLEARLRAAERRIARWPFSARTVAERPEVRVIPLTRYPFRLFYRVTADAVEILHIHHTARLSDLT